MNEVASSILGQAPNSPRGRLTSYMGDPVSPPAAGPTGIELMLEGVSSIQSAADGHLDRLNHMHMRAYGMPLSCLSKPASTQPTIQSTNGAKDGRVTSLKQALKQLEETLKLVHQAIGELEALV